MAGSGGHGGFDDDLRGASVTRAKKVDEKTVSTGPVVALDMKLAAEEADGWTLAKRNKRSLRLELFPFLTIYEAGTSGGGAPIRFGRSRRSPPWSFQFAVTDIISSARQSRSRPFALAR